MFFKVWHMANNVCAHVPLGFLKLLFIYETQSDPEFAI